MFALMTFVTGRFREAYFLYGALLYDILNQAQKQYLRILESYRHPIAATFFDFVNTVL